MNMPTNSNEIPEKTGSQSEIKTNRAVLFIEVLDDLFRFTYMIQHFYPHRHMPFTACTAQERQGVRLFGFQNWGK
jgi:hypothetical protein